MALLIYILEKHLLVAARKNSKGVERLWSNFTDDEGSISVTDNTTMLIDPKTSNGKDEKG